VLGRLYDEGWGVRRNPRAATRWYRRAGEGGLPEAFYFIASAYDAGDGVAPDRRRALAWYRKAAVAGDTAGKLAIATSLLTGRGLRKNESLGLRMLRRLAHHDGLAMDWLAYHYLQQRRFLLAEKWATRAVEHGESDAPARLAEIQNAHRVHLTHRVRKRPR
jgi:TPR repeat protein